MPRSACSPAFLLSLLPLVLVYCGDDSSSPSSTGASSSGTTGAASTGTDSGTTGQATGLGTMGGSGDTGTTAGVDETSTGLVDTGTTDEEGSSDSTGDGFCNAEDPGCGCDGIDLPDINGMDENGDGIDGLAHCSVFVSALGGDDANDGLSTDEPVATIARGIELSQTFDPPRPVLIAEGTYLESIDVANGTSLYGGYDASSWSRNLDSNETTVQATDDRTLIISDIDVPTEIDGLTIIGADFVGGSQSTYAVWVRDAVGAMLHLDYCTIVGGSAGEGAAGAHGSDGADGGHGSDAVVGLGGSGGGSACGATGGAGGAGDVCPSEDGDPGSAGGDATAVGAAGQAGSSNCDGCFDSATPGGLGGSGSNGVNGEAGAPATDLDGEFSADGVWTPAVASAAIDGLNGGGGGGGGAGGFDSDPIGCDIALGEEPCSGGGGGGGAGGCGGDGGQAGEGGGGSFGLVVIDSDIEVTNTEFALGVGGDGGAGGDGGDGGVGGNLGDGSPPCACGTCGEEPEPGDDGGAGGSGGAGGGAPGGCGGAVVGIASIGATSVTTGNLSFNGGVAGTPGVGGQGGSRTDGSFDDAPDGALGCEGVVAEERTY